MTIQEAIQQKKPFTSSEQKAMVNILYTHSWLTRQIQSYLRTYGITMKQYNVLRILRGESKPLTTSVIRERMLDASDTSRLVERLFQKDLVTREACPQDRRLVNVTITERGLILLKEVDEDNENFVNIVGNINSEELELLSDLLDKLRKD